jgi:amidase
VAGLVAGMALLEPGFAVSAPSPRTVGRLAIDADPAVDAAVDAALASVGWEIVPITLNRLDAAQAAALALLEAEAWASNRVLAEAAPDRIGASVLARLRAGGEISPAALDAAREEAARWRTTLSSLWDRVELLALPTLLGFPPALSDARDMARIRGLTAAVNQAGVPALALPVPAPGKLPASVQLIGPAGSEERLLAAGAVFEPAAWA